MYRLLTLTSSLTLLAALAPAAPVPTGADKPVYYYATKVGAKWVYDEHGKEVTLIVTEVEEKGGVFFVDTGELGEGGTVVPFERMAVSARGLSRVVNKGKTCDHCLLRFPWRPGETWNAWESDGKRWVTVTAGRPEKVKTAAGTFEAIRTDWDWR